MMFKIMEALELAFQTKEKTGIESYEDSLPPIPNHSNLIDSLDTSSWNNEDGENYVDSSALFYFPPS